MIIAFIIFIILYFTGIAFEIRHSKMYKLKLYDKKDTTINVSLGIIAVLARLIFQGTWVALWVYFSNFKLMEIPNTVWVWLLLFVLHEFIYYWVHRLSHHTKILWAIHVNHHSSDLLNFTTAARMPLFMFVVMFIFWTPLIFIGFNPLMVFTVSNISFIFAAFQHSHILGSIPILEWFFVMPAHHRVHHGSNDIYLNKNFGAVLIIFDRLFGTFQKIDDRITIKYGIEKNLSSSNILYVIFHEWIDLFKRKNLKVKQHELNKK